MLACQNVCPNKKQVAQQPVFEGCVVALVESADRREAISSQRGIEREF